MTRKISNKENIIALLSLIDTYKVLRGLNKVSNDSFIITKRKSRELIPFFFIGTDGKFNQHTTWWVLCCFRYYANILAQMEPACKHVENRFKNPAVISMHFQHLDRDRFRFFLYFCVCSTKSWFCSKSGT